MTKLNKNSIWDLCEEYIHLDSELARSISFNICLVHCKVRPSFLLQDVDYVGEDVLDRTLSFLKMLNNIFGLVQTPIGILVCLSEATDHFIELINNGIERNNMDTAMGIALGYMFAGELKSYHSQSERCMICFNMLIMHNGGETRPVQFMGMIATKEKVSKMMHQVLRQSECFHSAAAEIHKDIRVSVTIRLMSKNSDAADGPYVQNEIN